MCSRGNNVRAFCAFASESLKNLLGYYLKTSAGRDGRRGLDEREAAGRSTGDR